MLSMAAAADLSFSIDLEAAERCADRLDLVVALVEAVLAQHLVHQEGERGVGRVDDDGLAAQVGVGLDLGLHDQPVEAVVAAHHDRDVDLRDLGHRHRIVDAAHARSDSGRAPVLRAARRNPARSGCPRSSPRLAKKPWLCAASSGRFCMPWNTMMVRSVVCAARRRRHRGREAGRRQQTALQAHRARGMVILPDVLSLSVV